MAIPVKSIFIFVLAVDVVVGQIDLSYSELEEMGASCSPHDSCNIPRSESEDNLFHFRCECKSSCFRRDTCCIDSPYIDKQRTTFRLQQRKGKCSIVHLSEVKTLVVSRCDSRWRGSTVLKHMCEVPSNSSNDPLSITPVTSTKSEATYKNYFCALCNNDAEFIEFWHIEIGALFFNWNRSESEFFDELFFDENKNEWGVMMDDGSGGRQFRIMNINFEVPFHLSEIVRPCIENIVHGCHPRWRDEEVRKKCFSYMGIVYLKRSKHQKTSDAGTLVTYRNVHCAICNFVAINNATVCTRTGVPYSGKTPMSFTLLLDVNLSDGDRVGEVNPCKKGEVYDRFFKKCRTLSCGLPGYVITDDKCAKV